MRKCHLRNLAATAVILVPGQVLFAQEENEEDASTALQTGTAIGAVLLLALILVVLLRVLLRPR